MPYSDPEKRKEHHRNYMREVWYPKNKERHIETIRRAKKNALDFLTDYKEKGSCKDCGFKGMICPEVLEFDHLRNKKFTLSLYFMHTSSLETIQKEIAKCDLVCANCHRIRTVRRRIEAGV